MATVQERFVHLLLYSMNPVEHYHELLRLEIIVVQTIIQLGLIRIVSVQMVVQSTQV